MRAKPPAAAVASGPLSSWDLVEASGNHVSSLCARFGDGSVWCIAHDEEGYDLPLSRVPLPGPAVDLAGFSAEHCAVVAGGRLYCWGRPVTAEGPWSDRPIEVEVPEPIAEVAMPTFQLCVLAATRDRVWCWWTGVATTVGAANAPQAHPVEIPLRAASPLTRLTPSPDGACVLSADRELHCWGLTRFGPTPCPPARSFVEVHDVVGDLECVVRGEARSLYCWDRSTERASEPLARCEPPALPSRGVSGVRRALGTGGSVCALLSNDRLTCWGQDFHVRPGPLPADYDERVRAPVDAGHYPGATDLVGGGGLHCVLRDGVAPACVPALRRPRCMMRLIERGLEGPPIDCSDLPWDM